MLAQEVRDYVNEVARNKGFYPRFLGNVVQIGEHSFHPGDTVEQARQTLARLNYITLNEDGLEDYIVLKTEEVDDLLASTPLTPAGALLGNFLSGFPGVDNLEENPSIVFGETERAVAKSPNHDNLRKAREAKAAKEAALRAKIEADAAENKGN
jgi:hypothetical protein